MPRWQLANIEPLQVVLYTRSRPICRIRPAPEEHSLHYAGCIRASILWLIDITPSSTSYEVVWTRLYVDTAKLLRELSIPACINADGKRRTVVALSIRFILSHGESFCMA